MNRNLVYVPTLSVALALIAAACTDPKEIEAIKTKIETLQEQQTEVLGRLESLDKSLKLVLAKSAPAPARPAPRQADPNEVFDIPVGESFSKGPADAAVTIVEFSDFQCPFCSQAADLLDEVMEAYPDDVRFVYKNYPLPFHKQAMPAARAAIAAGRQGKFFEMHDKLFDNYRTLNDAYYATAAAELGLDVDRFKKDFADASTKALVDEEMEQARAAGVRGTPTIFINGKKPQGRSLELYKSIIDAILKDQKTS